MSNRQVVSALSLACLAAVCALAQSDLATTYDGQDVYFSAFWRLPGSTGKPYWTTIFHYDPSGAWTAAARSDDTGNVTLPFVTGDGSILGWRKGPAFFFSSFPGCATPATYQLAGIDIQSVKIKPYSLSISANGRFLATPGLSCDFNFAPAAVQDLITGQVWNPPAVSASSYFSAAPANDGTVVGLRVTANKQANELAVFYWRPGADSVKDIFSTQYIPGFSLSANGKVAVVSNRPPTGGEVRVIDLETGTAQLIFQQDTSASDALFPMTSISADGNRAIIALQDNRAGKTPPVFFWDRSAGDAAALPGVPEGVAGAVISGDGSVAWVSSKRNRLLRFDLNQGTMQEILGTFPTTLRWVPPGVYVNEAGGVPGSAVRYQGSGPVEGERFLLGDLEFPITAVDDPDQTAVQVPWELTSQANDQGITSFPLVVRKNGFPFELPLEFWATTRIAPLLERIPPIPGTYATVKAADADSLRPIDYDHPAMPGENLVVWLTGLGPLDQSLATGAPGPSNPPAHPLVHVDCGLVSTTGGPAWQGLPVPFVAYAPGQVGFYQLNVTIPSDWPPGVALLDCYTGTRSSTLSLPVGGAQH